MYRFIMSHHGVVMQQKQYRTLVHCYQEMTHPALGNNDVVKIYWLLFKMHQRNYSSEDDTLNLNR